MTEQENILILIPRLLQDHQRHASNSLHPSHYAVHSNTSSYNSSYSSPQSFGYSTPSPIQRQPASASRLNDPPPPAPSAPNRAFRASCDKIDYLSYQQNNWKSASALPEAPAFLSVKPKSTSDLLFGDDTPIRLNLVPTGKILSDISKLKKDEEEDQELDDPNECPPPPGKYFLVTFRKKTWIISCPKILTFWKQFSGSFSRILGLGLVLLLA